MDDWLLITIGPTDPSGESGLTDVRGMHSISQLGGFLSNAYLDRNQLYPTQLFIS